MAPVLLSPVCPLPGEMVFYRAQEVKATPMITVTHLSGLSGFTLSVTKVLNISLPVLDFSGSSVLMGAAVFGSLPCDQYLLCLLKRP